MIKPAPKNQDGIILLKEASADAILIFTRFKDTPIGAFMQNGLLLRVFVKREGLLKGTVCLGKISEIKEDIDSVFVILPGKEKGYVSFSELAGDDKIKQPKCGNNILVYIKKEAAKGKLITLGTNLPEEYDVFKEKAEHLTDYSVLKEGNNYIEEALSFAETFSGRQNVSFRMITDDEKIFDRITGFRKENNTEIKLYHDSQISLAAVYGLKSKIEEAFSKKVWLKSGGYLVIERTEAMTVIDVNSGKSHSKTASEDHFTEINREACTEIIRQSALRNLSGILIIDFINMKNPENRNEILRFLTENAMFNDPDFHVVGMTKLGLTECTRKKTGKMLCEQLKV